MVREKKGTPPGFIAHGSPEHRAMLGIDSLDPDDPEDAKKISKLQKALDAGVPPVMSKRKPINRQTYRPGEHIMYGFKRVGR